MKIFKIIYGGDVSYELALARSGFDRLDLRRVKLVEKFAIKMANNPQYAEWFPVNEPGPYLVMVAQSVTQASWGGN